MTVAGTLLAAHHEPYTCSKEPNQPLPYVPSSAVTVTVPTMQSAACISSMGPAAALPFETIMGRVAEVYSCLLRGSQKVQSEVTDLLPIRLNCYQSRGHKLDV